MKRKAILLACTMMSMAAPSMAQSLEKMNWFNEPKEWEIESDDEFTMQVPGKTDYWRISHYGFTVDDAPFYYATYGGEFEAKVKVSADYHTQFDQAGLMLRIDHKNWIKAGIEYVNGKYNISAVVTHKTSDWSVIELDKRIRHIWIKAVRRLDAVEIYYSFNDRDYTMMRNAWMKDNTPMMVGFMAASPDGDGFEATFEEFTVTHLPDLRREEWAAKQAQ